MSTNADDGDFAEAPAAEEAEELSVDEPARDQAKVSPAPSQRAERRERVEQCNSICDLSVAICDLEVRICSLSGSHQGDSTYADACQRASDDCEVAEYECDRCGES